MKGSRGKKRDHYVHLSRFALRQFRALQARTGMARWCFPGRDGESHVGVKSVSKQVGDRQHRFKQRKALRNRRNDNSLALSGGANGEWTPQDLRRTGATMMQALGVMPDVIDRCQNHVLAGSRVRRHYLKHDYADETKQAWSKLGAAIEAGPARRLRLVSGSARRPPAPRAGSTAGAARAQLGRRRTLDAAGGARCSNSGWQPTSGQPPEPVRRRGHPASTLCMFVVDLTRLLECLGA